jgi:hypothetical protein
MNVFEEEGVVEYLQARNSESSPITTLHPYDIEGRST